MMRKLMMGLLMAASLLMASGAFAAPQMSMAVPGSVDSEGRKVVTFVSSDPPGVRCNGNLQVAAEIANTFMVPVQLIPAGFAPDLPYPSVYFGDQMIAADGADHNGAVSFELVADVLDIEGVPRQEKPGLLFNDSVRGQLGDLKTLIRSGGN